MNHPPPFAQAADAAVLRRLLAEGCGGRATGVCGTADLALLRLLLEASITFSCSSSRSDGHATHNRVLGAASGAKINLSLFSFLCHFQFSLFSFSLVFGLSLPYQVKTK